MHSRKVKRDVTQRNALRKSIHTTPLPPSRPLRCRLYRRFGTLLTAKKFLKWNIGKRMKNCHVSGNVISWCFDTAVRSRGFPRCCVMTAVFSDVTTSNLVDKYRRLGGTCCLFSSVVGLNVARAKMLVDKFHQPSPYWVYKLIKILPSQRNTKLGSAGKHGAARFPFFPTFCESFWHVRLFVSKVGQIRITVYSSSDLASVAPGTENCRSSLNRSGNSKL
jgi:hypothetical protein